MRYRNLIALSSIELDEGSEASWLQAMPIGTYHHPVHGPINFTPENLTEYAASVNDQVRTGDLDIDYDHKKYHGGAAGWVKKAEVRGANGLWLLVEWTKDALNEIRSKPPKYKYFSPEFIEKWTDPKTRKEYKHVLMGGAITNRPFLRDIATLNFTEEQTEELMSKELAKLLGLPEDADEASILAKVQESVTTAANSDNASAQPSTEPKPLNAKPEDIKPEPQLVSATETTPADDPIVKLYEERVQKLEFLVRKGEVEKRVMTLSEGLAGGRKYGIAPVLLTEVQEIMLAAPTAKLSEQVYDVFDKITKDGLIELGERGTQTPSNDNVSATKKLSDAVDAYMKEHKDVSMGDAYDAVTFADPNLANDYLSEMHGSVQ